MQFCASGNLGKPPWVGKIGIADGTQSNFVLDGDCIVHGFVDTDFYGSFSACYVDGFVVIQGVSGVFAGNPDGAQLWGPGTLYTLPQSLITYPAGGITVTGGIFINGQTTAACFDKSVDPAVWHAGRALNLTNLAASIASGGFGGTATDPDIASTIALSTS